MTAKQKKELLDKIGAMAIRGHVDKESEVSITHKGEVLFFLCILDDIVSLLKEQGA